MKCPSCRVENLEDSKFCRKCATALPGGEASFTRTLIKGPAEFTSGTVIAVMNVKHYSRLTTIKIPGYVGRLFNRNDDFRMSPIHAAASAVRFFAADIR